VGGGGRRRRRRRKKKKKKLTALTLRSPQTSWKQLGYCIRQGKQSTHRVVSFWTWSVWLPKNSTFIQKLDQFPPSSDREWGATTKLDLTQRATLHPKISAKEGNIQNSKTPRPCFMPLLCLFLL
jgi:hypothetical protein